MVLSLMALHWYWWYAAMPLNVSFVNAFNAVTTVLFEATYRWIVHRIYCLLQLYCSGIAIYGLTFNPVDGLASHNW
jgi:hypothetical protein